MKTFIGIARIAAVLVTVGCLVTCDSYNIVEPRFYSDSDIVELSICSADKSGPLDPIYPTQFAASVCWLDEADKTMRVNLRMPESRHLMVSVVGSAGNTVATIATGQYFAGEIRFVYDASVLEDGVYGVSAITGDWQDTIWFEIE